MKVTQLILALLFLTVSWWRVFLRFHGKKSTENCTVQNFVIPPSCSNFRNQLILVAFVKCYAL